MKVWFVSNFIACAEPVSDEPKGHESGVDTDAPTETADTVPSGDFTLPDLSVPEPRVILLLVGDTLRWDTALDPAVMPFLAERSTTSGVLLANNWTDANWTQPSAMSLATGRYTFGFGADAYGDGRPEVPQDVPTVGEQLSAAGWATRMDTCNSVVTATSASRGFDSVEICVDPSLNSETALEQLTRSLEWAQTVPAEQKLFVWIHLMESHDPFNRFAEECAADAKEAAAGCSEDVTWIEGQSYAAEEQDACRAAVMAVYNCDNTQLDQDLEAGWALWEAAGLLDDAMVILVNDHGENVLEPHGNRIDPESGEANEELMETTLSHHRAMYAQVSRAPGWIWASSLTGPVTLDMPTSLIDAVPTVVHAAGLSTSGMDGSSIFALPSTPRTLQQFACEPERAWFGAVTVEADGRAWHTVAQRSRLDDSMRWARYDIYADPEEAEPIGPVDEAVVAAFDARWDESVTWSCQ